MGKLVVYSRSFAIKQRLKGLSIATALVVSGVAIGSVVTIKGDSKNITKPKAIVKKVVSRKKAKSIIRHRKIRVHPSAILEGQEWCRGRLAYIEIDTAKNYQYRFHCKK